MSSKGNQCTKLSIFEYKYLCLSMCSTAKCSYKKKKKTIAKQWKKNSAYAWQTNKCGLNTLWTEEVYLTGRSLFSSNQKRSFLGMAGMISTLLQALPTLFLTHAAILTGNLFTAYKFCTGSAALQPKFTRITIHVFRAWVACVRLFFFFFFFTASV